MKTGVTIAVILLLIFLGFQQWLIYTNEEPPSIENELAVIKSKLDTLQHTKDSLRSIIDTSRVKIIEVETKYEKIRDRIINQSVDSDCVSFADYLSNYKGLDSTYYSSATKDD